MPFDYRTRTHPRARGVKLKVDRQGLVIVSRRELSARKYEEVIERNWDWIKKTLGSQPQRPSLTETTGFQLAGKDYLLKIGKNHDFLVQESTVFMQNSTKAQEVFKKWLVRESKNFLVSKTKKLAHENDFRINRIYIKDQTTRWGSCSSKGNINLNWRLALSPVPVAEYVIIHELAHTVHMNHSTRFWRLVAQLDPNYREHRRWLKQKGDTLYFI